MFPNLQALIEDRAHAVRSAKDIANDAEKLGRVMDAAQIAQFDAWMDKVKVLDAQISAAQADLERRERLQAIEDNLTRPTGRKTDPGAPADPVPAPTLRIPAQCRRYGTLKAFKGADAEVKAYRSGMWLRATLLGDQRAARFCTEHNVGAADLRNALGTTPHESGGVLVPEELSQAIIDLRETYGAFRQNTRVVPMGRDVMVVPRRAGGVTIGPIGENPSSAPTEASPTWNDVTLTAKKAGGLTKMSTEVAEDAIIDMADWVVEEAAYAFATFEDQCGFTGTGASTYLGIRGLTNLLTAAGGLAGAVDAASGHDTFAEIDASDLATVISKLPAYALPGAKWYCSALAHSLVFGRLMAAAGGNTIQNLQGGYGLSYLGFPIVISQVLPAVTTDLSDVAMLLFGNLSKSSTMGDRRAVRVFVSPHRYMDTDQIGIIFTSRFDIVNHDVGTTTAAGPMVALVGE